MERWRPAGNKSAIMMKPRLYLTFALLALSLPAAASDSIRFVARAGYNLGATTPMGMPASISSIDAFRPSPSFMAGVDATWLVGQRWCLSAGLRLENKAMDADITAKGYHMELRKGAERIEGLFTGHVSQQASLWMLTLPVYATYTLTPKWQLKAGPYVSLMLSKDFSGTASDGYLRQGGPTGPRIDIGDTPDTWATYDISDEVRRLQLGLTLGADWQALPRLGFSLDLSMGFTGLFPADFSTVEQTLYPLYGTLGVCYEL